MARYLFIVPQDQPELHEHLRGDFSNDNDVQVLLDRRVAERRQRVEPYTPERRWADRRHQPGADAPLHRVGFGAGLPVLLVELQTVHATG